MLKNVLKSNSFSFFLILIFNILLINKTIRFDSKSVLTIFIVFTFFLITGHTINIIRENKSVFKLRIITAIIIFIIMSVPTNIIPDKYNYTSGLIIATECLMAELIVYFFIGYKIK
ncbi:hypothetical protein SDC9_129906 [bioreactor metagenome]|uniref:Uncharacterized protein n=1 Tax=bioreactor metagenome TaxID=1076179 RepID=A0A645D0U8_9ZZZZ